MTSIATARPGEFEGSEMTATGTQPPPFLDYYERLLHLDRAGAATLVERYLARSGDDLAGLYADVLVPALVHTGRQWESGAISVAHEHYISEVTRDLILRHGPRLRAPENPSGVAVACCTPSGRHVLGLMMACDLLRAAGLEVHLLGEGAPAESVVGFVAEVGADLLAVTVTLAEQLDEAARLIADARLAKPGLLVLAGGRALSARPDVAGALGADLAATDLRALPRLLPELLGRRSPG